VVVAVDGSPSSIWALRHGARIASALRLRLEAVTVWHQPDVFEGTLGDPLDAGTETMQRDAVHEAFGASPPLGFRRTLLQGEAVATLLHESRDADMLVLGSRGRGGLASLLLGSVSAACVAQATCPVLVCHADVPGHLASRTDATRTRSGRFDGAVV
jgi:nucleotide-binding universal stress UspA family protein